MRKHSPLSRPPAARDLVVHNGAGARWDAQSWMIWTMDIATTAPIKAAQIRSELVATCEWSRCVMSCRGRLGGYRLMEPGGQVSGEPVAGVCGSSAVLGRCGGLGCGEELVHDFGAGGDDGPECAAVDDLGGAGGGVPGEAGDLLDADAAVAEQADEGGARYYPAAQ